MSDRRPKARIEGGPHGSTIDAPTPPTRVPADARTTAFTVAGRRLVVISYELPATRPRRDELTDTERAVAADVVAGLPSAAIAAKRGTSRRTVEKQIERVFRKLGVHSRAELVALLALEQ